MLVFAFIQKKGVCGTAFNEMKTIIVSDVNKFPGHIVSDARSQSEIVIPLIKDKQVIGVLDKDAPIKNRFEQKDKLLLESFITILHSSLKIKKLKTVILPGFS